MKPWQQWITNLAEFFRNNPAARSWGIAAAVVVALLVVVLNGTFSGKREVSLFDTRELTADEIGLMQVAFGKSGLNEYEVLGSRIEVPKAKRGDYLKSLDEHGAIPQDLTAHLNKSQSSFDMFQSRSWQRNQQLVRKKQTIRDMVMQLRFVQRAIVDYDEARGVNPFDDMQRTAVVNVTPTGSRALENSEVKAIRDTVRGAVAGLSAENITIIDTFASKSHTGPLTPMEGGGQPLSMTKQLEERKYENKIRSALTAYPGVRVNVEASIDPVIRRVTDQHSVDGDPIVTSRLESHETSARLPAARPSRRIQTYGVGSNSQAHVDAQPPTVNRIQTETIHGMTRGKVETFETAGLTVTAVNVSIGIPEQCVRHFVSRDLDGIKLTAQEQQQRLAVAFEILKKDIEQKVAPLVPMGQEESVGQKIAITMDHEIPLDSEATIQTGRLAGIWPWLLAIIGSMFMIAYVFPSVIKRPTDTPNQSSRQTGEVANPNTGTASTTTLHNEKWSQQPTLPLTPATPALDDQQTGNAENTPDTQEQIRIQLDEWCRENPDAAAATIRQWLEKAG